METGFTAYRRSVGLLDHNLFAIDYPNASGKGAILKTVRPIGHAAPLKVIHFGGGVIRQQDVL